MSDFDFSPSSIIPLAKQTVEDMQTHLLDLRAVVLEAKFSAENAHSMLMKILADEGITQLSNSALPKDLQDLQGGASQIEWSSSLEQLYQNGLYAADMTAEALLQASVGDRKVIWSPLDPNWSLELLPSDPFRVAVSQDGLPMLVSPGGGMFNAPLNTLGAAPIAALPAAAAIGVAEVVVVVAGLATWAFIAYVGVQAVISALHSFNNLINRAGEVFLHRNMNECMKTSSPEACQKSFEIVSAGHVNVLDAETRKVLAENKALKNTNDALWAFAGIGAVFVLGYGAYKYQGSKALPQSPSDHAKTRTRIIAGSTASPDNVTTERAIAAAVTSTPTFFGCPRGPRGVDKSQYVEFRVLAKSQDVLDLERGHHVDVFLRDFPQQRGADLRV